MSYDYNTISRLYDDVREADFKTAEFLIDRAQMKENSRILEIGCGTGNYLRLVQELTKGEVWGIDSSQGMLQKAKEKCPRAVLVEGDAVELSGIPEASFDLVYMVDVIHHIKDIAGMFESIKRVLKQAAPVVVFSDNYRHIKNRLTTKYFPETLQAELNRYQDTDQLVEALGKTGFRKIDNGSLELPTIANYGPKLIEIASKKGYSMFGLIPEEAVQAGIERIKADMLKEDISYHQRAPYVIAIK